MWRYPIELPNQPGGRSFSEIPAWHFCDNQADADECVRLVLAGKKRATSPAVWELEHLDEKMPEPGDLNIITDWEGVPRCIIQTTHVEILPFYEVPALHTFREGEGDRTLAYWRAVHWEYYNRILQESRYKPTRDMPIVCERFRMVFPVSYQHV